MIACFIGQTGSGKTYLVKSLISQIKDNLIVFDTQNEYNAIRNAKYIQNIAEFRIFKGCGNLVCRYYDFNDYYMTLEILKKAKNFALVIDELGLFADSRNINEHLEALTLTHRHRKCLIFLATQSPIYIPSIQLVNATKVFIFHLEKNDVENLCRKIYISDTQAEQIPRLSPYNPRTKKAAQYLVIK